MKKLWLAGACALALATTIGSAAKADFVLADNVFADLGGTGFGVLPRLLTIQHNGLESGAVISQNGTQSFLSPVGFSGPGGTTLAGIPCNSQNSCSGGGLDTTQSNLVNISTFGWTSGANVAVGLDTNQTGSSDGLLFNNLVLNIYTSTGQLAGSFGSTTTPLITPEQLALQQGNGNSVFDLVLNAAQQAQFDAMLVTFSGQQLFAGLAASMGCNTAGCVGAADDGAESFLGFNQSVAVPGPIAGAGIPGLISALSGMVWLNRRRRQRQVA